MIFQLYKSKAHQAGRHGNRDFLKRSFTHAHFTLWTVNISDVICFMEMQKFIFIRGMRAS